MLALKIFIKLLPYLMPFIREMVLGKKSFFSALRDNKKKVLFIALVIFSFGLNFVIVPRLLSISMQYVTLDKKYKELEAKYQNLVSSPKHPVANNVEQKVTEPEPKAEPGPVKKAIKVIKRKKSAAKQQSDFDAKQAKEDFDEMRRRERESNRLH